MMKKTRYDLMGDSFSPSEFYAMIREGYASEFDGSVGCIYKVNPANTMEIQVVKDNPTLSETVEYLDSLDKVKLEHIMIEWCNS